jgi:hypothetical protein
VVADSFWPVSVCFGAGLSFGDRHAPPGKPEFLCLFRGPWTGDNLFPATTRSQIMRFMIDADDVENKISEEQRKFTIGE